MNLPTSILPSDTARSSTRHQQRCSRPLRSRLRVAYVIPGFETGGTERCVAELASLIDRERFTPLIVSLTRRGSAARWIDRDDVQVFELKKRAGNDIGVICRLARLLRQQDVDIVHSYNWGTLVESVVARRWAGVPWHIHSSRGTILGELELSGCRRCVRALFTNYALRSADAVLAVAESTRSGLANSTGFPLRRIQVIPNGVQTPSVDGNSGDIRKRIRDRLNVSPGTCVFGSVGRLVDVKNFSGLIDAVGQAIARGADARLVLVGDGPNRASLARVIEQRGLTSHIWCVGHQSDIGNWLSAFDVFVSSSLSEGMSQAVLEALAMGLPIIATNVGDHAAILDADEGCGLIVPPGEIEALADALERLAENADLRTALASNALDRHALRYTVARMVSAHDELYRSVAQC